VLKNVKIKKIFSWKNPEEFFYNFYEIIFQMDRSIPLKVLCVHKGNATDQPVSAL
jgi:hypothetical protein